MQQPYHEQHAEIMRAIGRMQGTLEAVLDEARRTNGRVTAVERAVAQIQVDISPINAMRNDVDGLKQWRWLLVGGGAAALFVLEKLGLLH